MMVSAMVLSRFEIQVPLEALEHVSNVIRITAEILHGIHQAIAVTETQEVRQLVLVKFLEADLDVLLQDEVQERTLADIEVGTNGLLGPIGTHGASRPRRGKSDEGEDVEEIALIGVYRAL